MENKFVAGYPMHDLIKKLYPVCRSLTGAGNRQTLKILQKIIPLQINEVASGTKVFDWQVPDEWNVKDAYVKNFRGEKIIDFQKSNLHLVGYSTPLHQRMSSAELFPHLHTLPEFPKWIPYLTSYYKRDWGFCLTHEDFLKLNKKETYEVVINSELKPGFLSYGEMFLPGRIKEEVLLSTYICHPSLCNDNLSGIALLAHLAKSLMEKKNRYSYRFLFIPETIGSIAWLQINRRKIKKIKFGLCINNVGSKHDFTYMKTRNDATEIDFAAAKALKDSSFKHQIIDFDPTGSDERQFSSPGINLSVGSLLKGRYGDYPEYHTSADNLRFVSPVYLNQSLSVYQSIIDILEHNQCYQNLNPFCEPQLGRRGLYRFLGSQKNGAEIEHALLWVLNFSDRHHDLLSISQKSNIKFAQIYQASQLLKKHKLIKQI